MSIRGDGEGRDMDIGARRGLSLRFKFHRRCASKIGALPPWRKRCPTPSKAFGFLSLTTVPSDA